jgi:protein ImuB
MSRIACVDVPALPLQLLQRREPSWRGHPTVVVRDDRPQGEVLWVDELARRAGVVPGMSFAAARNLTAEVRAGVVPDEQLRDAVGELFAVLTGFSPRVEPRPAPAGVAWIDPSGMTSLYGSVDAWAESVHRALSGRGLQSAVVVGFSRFRTYALARLHQGPWVLHDPHQEAKLAAAVPLARLDVSPALRDGLALLAVHTLGELLRLPASELRLRFGEEAAGLHERLSEGEWSGLQPRKLIDPVREGFELEPPDATSTRLLFALGRSLKRGLETLAGRGLALSALRIELQLDHAGVHEEQLEPAHPTLDGEQLLELIRLRLDALRLRAAVAGARLELEGARADATQIALFDSQRRRDLHAGARALARVRAAFGDASVTRASVRAAHLPEASITWTPCVDLTFPRPPSLRDPVLGVAPSGAASNDPEPPPLVRRVLPRPVPLPPRPRHEPERWLMEYGSVTALHGPYRVSGGWWVRTVERDYYYAQTRRGDVLWLYFDRPRRRWFLHGAVD